MTTQVTWTSSQPDGPTALYFASDSRFSWLGSTGRWDHGRKIFLSCSGPDLFAYVGDVIFGAGVLDQLCAAIDCGAALANVIDPEKRHESVSEIIASSFARLANVPPQPVDILHAMPDNTTRGFRVWRMSKFANGPWSSTPVVLQDALQVAAFGSGSEGFMNEYKRRKDAHQGK